jgi:hypothetical protein
MRHLNCAGSNAIEDQVIAEWTPADAEMFVARNQLLPKRRIRQRLAFFSQLLHKI